LVFCASTISARGHAFAGDSPARVSARPNLVFILAADIGYGDLGCYGAPQVKSPNLDRMAREGLRFTDAYAPASVCTPTRYSILTGEYAWRAKAGRAVLDGDAPLCIEPERFTLADLLRQAGYRTGCVGKWHLGFGIARWPGKIKPATTARLVTQLDLFATAAELTAQALRPGVAPDSISFLPTLLDRPETPPRRAVVLQSGSAQLALRSGDWKYIPILERVGGWYADRSPGLQGEGLFNLKDDVGEQRNLAAAEPARLEELRRLLRSVQQEEGKSK
jgi:arylsulfatase A-like enzyme